MIARNIKTGITYEEWVYVKGSKNRYIISNKGNLVRVKDFSVKMISDISIDYKKGIKRHKLNTQGYLYFNLQGCNKYIRKHYQLAHRLVAFHFIPNPKYKRFVNHIDNDKTNNNVNNLEWVTPQENMHHAYSIGSRKDKLRKINVYDLIKVK